MLLGGAVACREEPLPVPPPPRAGDDPRFDGRPPRLTWNILQRDPFQDPYGFVIVRNDDPFPWTMLDQIRLSIVTPNAPPIERRGLTTQGWIELRCPPPPAVPAGSVLVIPYQSCAAPWEGFYDYDPVRSVHGRPTPRLPADPHARTWSLRLVAREGALEIDLGDGPQLLR
jgi:hypothetical protein